MLPKAGHQVPLEAGAPWLIFDPGFGKGVLKNRKNILTAPLRACVRQAYVETLPWGLPPEISRGYRLSHGISVWEAEQELPIVFVRRLTHHQVLRCRVDVSQTPLEHTRRIQR